MQEKKFAWWQNALGGFGLFSKPPELLPYEDDGFLQRLEEILAAETALTIISPNSQPSSATPAEADTQSSVPDGTEAPVSTPTTESVPDLPAGAVPELVPESASRHELGEESAIEEAVVVETTRTPEPTEEIAAQPHSKLISGAKHPFSKKPASERLSIREISPAVPPGEGPSLVETSASPAVETSPSLDSGQAFPRRRTASFIPESVPAPNPSPEKAAAQKKTGGNDDESPFSVMVGQVYDGPLDLLLDLIRKQDIDIYDIPIATITAQFLAYVNHLSATDVDVAGEFIYTASLLIHIKSKMLLPRSPAGPDDAPEDPRRELVERLLEHERFKNAAQMLQQKQMLEAATWTNPGVREFQDVANDEPDIAADTVDLVRIFHEILERARKRPVIDLEEDTATVGQMIQFLSRRLSIEDKPVALRSLLSNTRSEKALVAIFLALLELVRLQAILLRQDRAFSEIFIKKQAGFETVMNEGLANARDDWR
ncbi:MAG: segregation/condensation protein A [Terracidiphilus sp.]|jgi:segregation and condensation protein A